MLFTKMHGIGNDFIIVNCLETPFEFELEHASLVLCDRRRGIGADGLILIEKSETADFKMVIYNSDGSEAGMCGNGARCVGKYIFDNGMIDKKVFSLETKSGIIKIDIAEKDKKAESIRIDMGAPVMEVEKIPAIVSVSPAVNYPVNVGGKEYNVTLVSMGNPHCVVFCNNVREIELSNIGPQFEHHEMFPDRTNTEFVSVTDRGHVVMRVWERGAGETMACGTGACAVAVASYMCGYTDRKVEVRLDGGVLEIEYRESDGHLYLTGPAEAVYSGELDRQIAEKLDRA